MPNSYTITGTGANRRLTPVAGSGLPVIKVGTGLAGINLQSFVDALNRKIDASPTYANELKWAGSEGIVLSGVTYNANTSYLNTNPNEATRVDPRLVGGFANWNGDNQGTGVFVNRPSVPFELRAYLSITGNTFNGVIDYDAMAEVFLHEGIGHPRYGRHVWNNYPGDYQRVLRDGVYLMDFRVDSELGVPAAVNAQGASILQAAHPTMATGNLALTVDGYKALLRRSGWTEAQIAAVPAANLSGNYSFTDSAGHTVWVLSDTEYFTLRAIERRDSVETFYRKNHRINAGNREVPLYIQREGTTVSAFFGAIGGALTTVDGGQLGMALGSTLGKRLSDQPLAQIVASATLSAVLGALGEFIDTEVFGGTQTTTNFLTRTRDPLSGKEQIGLSGNFGKTILSNIEGGSIGAVSSYLTAELVKAIGLGGVPAEVANSVGGAVISQIISNSLHLGETYQVVRNGQLVTETRNLFSQIGPSLLVNAIGSYIGTKLAAEIKTFDTVGGQIGSAVGAIYGSFAATGALASLAASSGVAAAGAGTLANAAAFAAANPIVAIAVVAVIVLVDLAAGWADRLDLRRHSALRRRRHLGCEQERVRRRQCLCAQGRIQGCRAPDGNRGQRQSQFGALCQRCRASRCQGRSGRQLRDAQEGLRVSRNIDAGHQCDHGALFGQERRRTAGDARHLYRAVRHGRSARRGRRLCQAHTGDFAGQCAGQSEQQCGGRRRAVRHDDAAR
ncbi:hypothetical protein PIB19_04245 [Sphingomonas sp. 7/4-4]|uniref:hypothetical protein n=1 Tax=Sphingomonas sp. 7/4-4 TaxID=3018446 RepID=UPI0022F3E66D|nr:hypothetical protein [Sphingomonas sp. 7/4-4]WBY08675.1 hypothetical protein PIB19_04245 [Sphingomonas sp. 7/4-4]